MDELLPYYERELALLSRHAREFADKYPKIAGRLLMAGETVEDPHVERLIQSFALIASRIHKKLEDDYPEFTGALFQSLFPTYLRPFPSCTIANFSMGNTLAQLSAPLHIPRGTNLASRAVKGVQCKFKTTYDVQIYALALTSASFRTYIETPDGTQLPSAVNAAISIKLEALSEQFTFGKKAGGRLRIYIDADASLAALIREALLQHTIGVSVDTGNGPWKPLNKTVFYPVGFEANERILPEDARSRPAFHILTEYLAFPEKFSFIDLDLDTLEAFGTQRSLTLHVLLDLAEDREKYERLLDQLGPNNFRLFCTPLVNLFTQQAEPIRLTHNKSSYTLVPDARRAYAFEVFSVDNVTLVSETEGKQALYGFQPFYSFKHGEQEHAGRYWHMLRDERIAHTSPGHEYELTVIDQHFDPLDISEDTLSLKLTCTNRDLPAQLPISQSGGDVFIEGIGAIKTISLLRKATSSQRFNHEGEGSWRLISLLSLGRLSLVEASGDPLREALVLHDLTGSPENKRLIDGIVKVSSCAATTRISGNPFPTFVKGTEVRIQIKPGNFVGSGVWLFAEIMSRFLSEYVHINSFVKLYVESATTGEVLVECPARSGNIALV